MLPPRDSIAEAAGVFPRQLYTASRDTSLRRGQRPVPVAASVCKVTIIQLGFKAVRTDETVFVKCENR